MKYSLLWHLILSMWSFHHLCCNHCLLFKAITYGFGVELDQTYPGNRQQRLSHTCLGFQIDRFLMCQLQMAKYLFHTLSADLCSRLPSQLASILTGQFRYFTSHNTTLLKKIQRIFFWYFRDRCDLLHLTIFRCASISSTEITKCHGKGREIWGLYSRESRETGIPAHPWSVSR